MPGSPIRISTDLSLLAAPRGFSQLTTSFFVSWRLGIHHVPLIPRLSRLKLIPRLLLTYLSVTSVTLILICALFVKTLRYLS